MIENFDKRVILKMKSQKVRFVISTNIHEFYIPQNLDVCGISYLNDIKFYLIHSVICSTSMYLIIYSLIKWPKSF